MPFRKQFDYETYKELYGLMSETLNIGFMLVDYDYSILEVNNRLLGMMGKTVEQKSELVGHSIREFFQDQDDFRRWLEWLRAHDHETTFQYEDTLRTLGASDRAVLVSVHLLPDVKRPGKRDGISTVLIADIEDQKRVLEELGNANLELTKSKSDIENKNKMLETILFGIGDCVTIYDPDGNLLLSNPKGQRIRGDRERPLLPLESGAVKELTLTIDGKPRHFSGQMKGIDDIRGERFAYVETLKDITYEIELESRNQELRRIKRELGYSDIKSRIVGSSRSMQAVLEAILRCSAVVSPLLLLGETGVGKEMVARAIHENSHRKDKPFVAVNCGAFPDTLIESELFGHTKGAFTGAVSDRIGLFREANGGTLFLDEVGDIKLELQVKLLRALEEGTIRPVGEDKAYPVDVRIISATNRDLKELVEQRRFRHDLYYRLAVIPIFIPPLRDRKEDIFPLLNHFMKKQIKTHGIQAKRPNREALKAIINYSWPGNIRELENAIEYALTMASGEELTPEDFPMEQLDWKSTATGRVEKLEPPDRVLKKTTPSYPSLRILEEEKMHREREKVFEALRLHDGNRTLAAKELGISKSTLWRKIKRTELDR
jgi:transcriptional regulator with PAS, ATPase and Fis domain